MTRYLIGIVLLILVGYGGIEAWPLISGPGLSIASPENYASFPGGIVEVRGSAPRAVVLMLDGAPLVHDQEGNFSSTLTFPKGGSILTFVATDRFGRTVTATRSVYVP
jgi:hypothetical protein